MKAIAIIKNLNSDESNKWQFDKVMSAIAYDVDLSVVFMPSAIKQLSSNKAWISLKLYGVDAVYFLNSNKLKNYQSLIKVEEISPNQLRIIIQKSDIVI